MHIDSLGNSDYIYSLRGKQPQNRADNPEASPQAEGRDQLSVGASSKIRRALNEIPEIRPEVVERGRQLAADPNYPPMDVVRKIAQLITPFSEG